MNKSAKVVLGRVLIKRAHVGFWGRSGNLVLDQSKTGFAHCGSRALLGEGGNLPPSLVLLMKREASGRCQPLG